VVQCVAMFLVCYSVLQCVVVCCSMLPCVAVCCSVLQCIVVRSYSLPLLQGGEDPQDSLRCTSFFAKDSLIIGLFCGK